LYARLHRGQRDADRVRRLACGHHRALARSIGGGSRRVLRGSAWKARRARILGALAVARGEKERSKSKPASRPPSIDHIFGVRLTKRRAATNLDGPLRRIENANLSASLPGTGAILPPLLQRQRGVGSLKPAPRFSFRRACCQPFCVS
jgi:hypothetical protein